MISLHGVSSSLVARNESWVRQEAHRVGRGLPSNVEKADLIQVGLIAVAQASLGFEWDGDADSAEGRDAFVRYARLRVRGAMLDELRQMDTLGRAERRKVKVVQIARERLHALHGVRPRLAELASACSMEIDEVSRLEQLAWQAQTESMTPDPDAEAAPEHRHPATEADEVEARVTTAIVLRRLETFFANLPERDRQLIDTHLGVGLTTTELAKSWDVSPSRVSQMFKGVCGRAARYFGNAEEPAFDRRASKDDSDIDPAISARASELPEPPDDRGWEQRMEDILGGEAFSDKVRAVRGGLVVRSGTLWG